MRELLEFHEYKALGCNMADIVEVVESSNKKRFQLFRETTELMMRAAQGQYMTNVDDKRFLESLIDLALLPEV